MLLLLFSLLTSNLNATTYELSWKENLFREDGSVLKESEISHYNIYWGTESKDYQHNIKVLRPNKTKPLPTSYTVDFSDGIDYFFVMTTVDIQNRESLYGEEVKLLAAMPPISPVLICEPSADLNSDGVVNAADLAIFKTHFFKRF